MRAFLPILAIFAAVLFSTGAAQGQETNRYTKVANRLAELLNAGDCAGIQTNFNKEMDAALPLLNENRNKILRVCRVYAWNSADQDDLYQEILSQIWRGLPGLKEKQFANTWLYRVGINTAISFVRKRASRSGRVVHFEHADLTRVIESQQTTEEKTDDRIANLYSAIYRLDPLEKALVTLFLEDFTYEQMAEATGINANHVGVMLHRAKKKLFSLMMEAPK